MTKEQAIKLFESKFWEDMTATQVALFQLQEEKLCMPFDIFHGCVEEALGYPVMTHEFAFGGADRMLKEIIMKSLPNYAEDILNVI